MDALLGKAEYYSIWLGGGGGEKLFDNLDSGSYPSNSKILQQQKTTIFHRIQKTQTCRVFTVFL